MKLLVLTRASDAKNPGLIHLTKSLDKWKYSYEVIIDKSTEREGNGPLYWANWLKANNKGFTHFINTDAFDTLAMGSPGELIEKYKAIYDGKFVYSTEKNCYPRGDWALNFQQNSRWRYMNGGQYMAPVELFIDVIDTAERKKGIDDNEFANSLFLFYDKGSITGDFNCEIFQALYNNNGSFQPVNEGEYAISDEYRLINLINLTKPVLIHGNGKVDMRSIYHHKYKNY